MKIYRIIFAILTIIFLFSGYKTYSVNIEKQTQKETIILLVHGQGKDRSNFQDSSNKKDLKRDLLMKYLIEDLKIDPIRIHSMDFTDNLEEIQKKMVEIGAVGYKNPAINKKDSGIENIDETTPYGNIQLKQSEKNVGNEILKSSKKPSINKNYKDLQALPREDLPKKVIAISVDEGANAVRGYIHSQELALDGAFDQIKDNQFETFQAMQVKAEDFSIKKKEFREVMAGLDQAQVVFNSIGEIDIQNLKLEEINSYQAKLLAGEEELKKIAVAKVKEMTGRDRSWFSMPSIMYEDGAMLRKEYGLYWQKMTDLMRLNLKIQAMKDELGIVNNDDIFGQIKKRFDSKMNEARLEAIAKIKEKYQVDVSSWTLDEIQKQYGENLKTELGAAWESKMEQIQNLQQVISGDGSRYLSQLGDIIGDYQSFDFGRAVEDRVRDIQSRLSGFYSMPIDQLIMVNAPGLNQDELKKLIVVGQIANLADEITIDSADLIFSTYKEIYSIMDKINAIAKTFNIQDQLKPKIRNESDLDEYAAIKTYDKSDLTNESKKRFNLLNTVLRSMMVYMVLDPNHAYQKIDDAVGWNNMFSLYEEMVRAHKYVLYTREKVLNDLLKVDLALGSIDQGINIHEILNKMTTFKSYQEVVLDPTETFEIVKLKLRNEVANTYAYIYNTLGDANKGKNLDAATDFIKELGQPNTFDPTLYFVYLNGIAKVLRSDKLISLGIYESVAAYYSAKELKTSNGKSVKELLQTANLKDFYTSSSKLGLTDSQANLVLRTYQPKYAAIQSESSIAPNKEACKTAILTDYALKTGKDLPGINNMMSLLDSLPGGIGNPYFLATVLSNDFMNISDDSKLKAVLLSYFGTGIFTKEGNFVYESTNLGLEQYNEFKNGALKSVEQIQKQSSNLSKFISEELPECIAAEMGIEAALLAFPWTSWILSNPLSRGALRSATFVIAFQNLTPKLGNALDSLAMDTVVQTGRQNGLFDKIKEALYQEPNIIIDGIYTKLYQPLNTTSFTSQSAPNQAVRPETNFEEAQYYWPDYDLLNKKYIAKDTITETKSTTLGTQSSNKAYYQKNSLLKMAQKSQSQLTTKSFRTQNDSMNVLIPNTVQNNFIEVETFSTSANEIIVRGTFNDFTPTSSSCQFSFNFGGFETAHILNDFGHFETRPLPLSEGQNMLSFKMTNAAGYSSSKIMKIIKTSISVQPVLDLLSPKPETAINIRNPKLHLAYQNMKYIGNETNAGQEINKICIDSIKVLKELAIKNPSSNEIRYEYETLVDLAASGNWISASGFRITPNTSKTNLNAIEADYALTVTEDGKYIVQTQAYDGFQTHSFLRYSFVIDTVKPTIFFKTNVSFVRFNPDFGTKAKVLYELTDNFSKFLKNIKFQIKDKDQNVIYEVTENIKSAGIYAFEWDGKPNIKTSDSGLRTSASVTYNLQISVEDDASNIGTNTFQLVIDKTAPRIYDAKTDQSIYNASALYGLLEFKSDKPIRGYIQLKNTEVGFTEGFMFNSTPNIMDQGDNIVIGNIVTLNFQVGLDSYPDGSYQALISAMDDLGNIATQNINFMIQKTPPSIEDISVIPLILNAKNQYKTTITIKAKNKSNPNSSIKGVRKIINQKGTEIATSSITIQNGVATALDYSATDLPKGAYHIQIALLDDYGNQSICGMDITKDGMDPEISYPGDNTMVSDIVVIKGRVMDPDLTNDRSVEKFQLLYKPGAYSNLTTQDLSGFLGFSEAVPELKVPQRHRRMSSFIAKENEGTVEVITTDTLGYFDTRTLPKDQDYTLVLAVYEQGMGITGFTSKVVNTTTFEDDQKINTIQNMGQIELDPLLPTYTFGLNQTEFVPIQFRLLNGNANLALEIVNIKTNKVVFNHQYPNITNEPYWGVPSEAQLTKDGIYIYKEGDFINLILKNSGSIPKDFNLTVIANNGSFSDLEGVSQAKQSNSLIINETVTGTKKIRFKSSATQTMISVNPGKNIDIDQILTLKNSIYLGKTLENPKSSMVTIGNDFEPNLLVNWNGKITGTDGYVGSGDYLVKIIAEGIEGKGYQERFFQIHIETPTKVEVVYETPQIFDPYTAQEIYALRYIVNKTCHTSAWITDSKDVFLQNLKTDELTHPTNSDNPYEIFWTGTVGRGELASEGIYQLYLKITPDDGSKEQMITRTIQIKSKGFSINLGDYFGPMGEKIRLNQNPINLVKGQSGFYWKSTVSGKLYPPIHLNYKVDISKIFQTVTANTYIPYVAMAHRWFETVKLNVDYEFRIKLRRHAYRYDVINLIPWSGWVDIDTQEVLRENSPIKIKINQQIDEVSKEYTFSDSLDNGNPSTKPEIDVLGASININLRTPDGKLIESQTVTLNEGDFIPGEKGAFRYKAGYEILDRWKQGHLSNTAMIKIKVWVDVKLEEKMSYSRLTNRYYPWWGYVNKNQSKIVDFGAYLSEESKLDFPKTGFFELDKDSYEKELAKIYKKNGDTNLVTADVTAVCNQLNQTITSAGVGSDCSNYLEDGFFEVIPVNASKLDNDFYKMENMDRSGAKYGTKWKVSTQKSDNVYLPWPIQTVADNAFYKLILDYNSKMKDLIKDYDSENLSPTKAKKVESVILDKSMNSAGTFDLNTTTYFTEIDTNGITNGQTEYGFGATMNYSGGLKQEIAFLSDLRAQINALLPPNTDHYSYEINVRSGSPTINLNIQTSRYNSYEKVVVAQVAESDWQIKWNGAKDDYLKPVKGELYETITDYMPPVFKNENKKLELFFRNGYFTTTSATEARLGMNLLYWQAIGQPESLNSYLRDITWATPQIYDLRGKINEDIELIPETAQLTKPNTDQLESKWNSFEVKLKMGNKQNMFVELTAQEPYLSQLRDHGYRLSYRQDESWKSIECATDKRENVLGYWNVARLNGKYTLKIEDLKTNAISIKDFWVGTLVPAQNQEVCHVYSPYGRVDLAFAPNSFEADTLVTVTPVRLNEVHVSNIPDISDLDFMPIVEIMPSSDFTNKTHPTLTYKYTKQEYDAINEGTYPGLVKGNGIDLDKVNIWHINKTGVLEPATPSVYAGTDENGKSTRWLDVDLDGRRGTKGDVYQIAAEVSHFSTYAAVEGFVPDQPKLFTTQEKANSETVDLYGFAQVKQEDILWGLLKETLEIEMVRDDDPNFNEEKESGAPPVIFHQSDLNLTRDIKDPTSNNLQIKNFPLAEGVNYIFLTYKRGSLKVINRPYAVIKIDRDTIPPKLIFSDFIFSQEPAKRVYYFSPNQDNKKDRFEITFLPSEPITFRVSVMSEQGTQVAGFTQEVPKLLGNYILFSWNGTYDNNSSPNFYTVLPDGTYHMALWAMDNAGNLSQQETLKVVLDTQKPDLTVESYPTKVSIKTEEGLAIPVKLLLQDKMALESVQFKLSAQQKILSDKEETLTGTKANLDFDIRTLLSSSARDYLIAHEGIYQLTIILKDMAGNFCSKNIEFEVDNTPPVITDFKVSLTTINITDIEDKKAVLTCKIQDPNSKPDTLLEITLKTIANRTEKTKTWPANQWDLSIPLTYDDFALQTGTNKIQLIVSDGVNQTSMEKEVVVDLEAPKLLKKTNQNFWVSKKNKKLFGFDAEFSEPIKTYKLIIINEKNVEVTVSVLEYSQEKVAESMQIHYTIPKEIVEFESRYNVICRYWDFFGNQGELIRESFIVDNTPPKLTRKRKIFIRAN